MYRLRETPQKNGVTPPPRPSGLWLGANPREREVVFDHKKKAEKGLEKYQPPKSTGAHPHAKREGFGPWKEA